MSLRNDTSYISRVACVCELERTACCDTCMYFIAVETFGFDALVSNIVNIEKKKKKEEEISKEKYVYFQDSEYFSQICFKIIKSRKISQLNVIFNVNVVRSY